MTLNPYYIYVTLHLLECLDETLAYEALDTKWDSHPRCQVS